MTVSPGSRCRPVLSCRAEEDGLEGASCALVWSSTTSTTWAQRRPEDDSGHLSCAPAILGSIEGTVLSASWPTCTTNLFHVCLWWPSTAIRMKIISHNQQVVWSFSFGGEEVTF